jgi:hypothetical protein
MSLLLKFLYSIVIPIDKLNYYVFDSISVLSVEFASILILRFCQKKPGVLNLPGFIFGKQ